MKKKLIITTFIMLFIVSCGANLEKKMFMLTCDGESLGDGGTAYCECAWSEYKIYGDNEEALLKAVDKNCTNLLY